MERRNFLRRMGATTAIALGSQGIGVSMAMASTPTTPIPPGWVGGFEASNPAFAYPDPDLSSLPMLDNMANIDKLTRQQAVLWPEFSWDTEKDNSDPKRCYQMFAPDISRLGYTDEGRVYSIICPQQGACSTNLGCLNVEVTVTGQRGWADETTRTMAADMTVTGKIWFSPSAHQKWYMKVLWEHFASSDLPFPSDKAKAIRVTTHKKGDASQPIFALRSGQSSDFAIPDFAKHPEAWDVSNLEVQIGPIVPSGSDKVDEFNTLVLELFNMASGNMLQNGNVLAWNVWFTQPQIVDQTEWRNHAEKWRESTVADHGSPDGPGTSAKYFDGTPFKASQALLRAEEDKIKAFIAKHI